MAKTLRDLVATNPPLRVEEDVEIHSMLPGHDDPRQHLLEQLMPTGSINVNPAEMLRRRAEGDVTEEQFVTYMDLVDPGWRSRRPHGGSTEDGGGSTRPYDSDLAGDVSFSPSFDATIRRDE